MSWWVFLIAGWMLAAGWIMNGLLLIRYFYKKRLGRCAGSLPDPEEWPAVSVIVAARDESQSIEQALGSIAGMDYPKFEVVAVDDRSGDGTGEIMERAAAGDARIRVLHIHELPQGWLGKCHALDRGARQASGELLLFTDGDVHFKGETLRLAVRYVLAHRIDHLVLCPGVTSKSYWEDAIKSYFAMSFVMSMRAWAVSGPSKNAYIGAGAFNLVRRAAYDDIGGHETLRMEVADDIMLGKRIKQKGYRQDALLAPEHLELTWLEGVRGFVRGLEKNAFAALGFSIPMLLYATVLMIVFHAVPYLGALAFQDARISGYVAAAIAAHMAFGCCASTYGRGWRLLPALPAAAFIFLWTIWRSALVTLRRGGVLWRDTFYSINNLKRR
jgi:hypothetical protein